MEVREREYQNIPECHVRDDSGFSEPNIGRYAVDVVATQAAGRRLGLFKHLFLKCNVHR